MLPLLLLLLLLLLLRGGGNGPGPAARTPRLAFPCALCPIYPDRPPPNLQHAVKL
jgi:hypothetical protein